VAETPPDSRVIPRIDSAPSYRMDDCGNRALLQFSPADKPKFSLDLGTLWSDLKRLKWFVSAGFCSSTHCFLVLERHRAELPVTRAVARALTTLERVLTGESPKVLAYEESVSTSTVAARCGVGLQSIAAETTVSAAPVLILLAAHSARGIKLGSALVRPITGAEGERWLVRYERTDREFKAALSEAECEVVRLLVEGRSHAQMSRIRNRSERTIANQLGSAFRKLGASGRTALVAQLLRQCQSKPDTDAEQRLH